MAGTPYVCWLDLVDAFGVCILHTEEGRELEAKKEATQAVWKAKNDKWIKVW